MAHLSLGLKHNFFFVSSSQNCQCYCFQFTAIILMGIGGYGSTGGAHRIWRHKFYKANLPLRILTAIAHIIALWFFNSHCKQNLHINYKRVRATQSIWIVITESTANSLRRTQILMTLVEDSSSLTLDGSSARNIPTWNTPGVQSI